ncbi:flippase activity-associated protein Agl23 [Candidatus Chlorohelix sp.]|uniref:flippase activity-associated protein Agl23 n=1 Tax=Candidatus Chlorohelix sp. TaxID=3139201 RepID=UPI00303E29DB
MAKSYANRIDTTEQSDGDTEEKLQPESALDRVLAFGWLNWESILWIAIIVLAIASRLASLDLKAIHHDESIHAKWSYDMFKGTFIYRYDPTWHGPLLYYLVSASFMLFGGDNETTARLMPALFGVATVAICWFLRPLLGRFGALFAGTLVLISPTILYFNRSLRHDSFALFGELLFAIGVFRFLQSRKWLWMAWAGLGLAITYASHEMVFLNTVILVTWLGLAFVVELVTLPKVVKNRIAKRITERLQEIKNKPFPEQSKRAIITDGELDEPEIPPQELAVSEEVHILEPLTAEPSVEQEIPAHATRSWWKALLIYTKAGWFGFSYTFAGTLLLATLVSLRFALMSKNPILPNNGIPKGNLLLIGPEVDKWLAYVFNGALLGIALGLVAGWLVSLADVAEDDKFAGSAALRGAIRIFRHPKAIAAFFIAFALLYIPLFGNFFTYIPGLADGIYRGVEYWASVHNSRRLDQPWFYYPLLMMLYETLPFLLSLVALVIIPVAWFRRAMSKGQPIFSVKGLFAGYTLWWSALAMVLYSIAGEKVPWLNMQVTLPAILAASVLVQRTAQRVDWRSVVKPSQGLLFGALFILMFAGVAVIIGQLIGIGELGITIVPPDGTTIESARLYRTLETILVLIVLTLLFYFSLKLWRSGRVTGKTMRAVILTLVVLTLGGYGLKSSIGATYDHPDIAVEPLVQVQTAPDVVLFTKRLEKLARDARDQFRITPPTPGTTTQAPDPAGIKGLPILVSNEVSWPLVWYLRSYNNVGYFTPNDDATQPDVVALPLKDSRGNPYAVIAIQLSEDQPKLQAALKGQYTRYQIRFRWWFPEDDNGYGSIGKAPLESTTPELDKKKIQNTDWGKLWNTFTKQPSVGQMWRYIMYRELATTPGQVNMVYYIRNELEPDLPLVSSTTPATASPQPTETATSGVFDMTASKQAGTNNGQYRLPRTLTVAPNGDFLVLDSGNGRVQRFSADGKFLSKFGKAGAGDGQFTLIQLSTGAPTTNGQNDGGPGGIAVDEDGNIYVADTWGYRIEKFDANGNFLLKWGEGLDSRNDPAQALRNPKGFYGPRGLFYDRNRKELYVADTGNRRIVVFDKNGIPLRQFGTSGTEPGQFNEPTSVAVSDDGKVYVTDLRNKRVQVLDLDGKYLSEITIPYWHEQPLSEPYITLDKVGNAYISDSANATIYRIGKDDHEIAIINDSALLNPVGLAIGKDGNLYIADAKRHSIIKLLL